MPISGFEAAGGAFQSGPSGDIVFADKTFAALFEFEAPTDLLGTPLANILPDGPLQEELSRSGGHPLAFRTVITGRRGNRKRVVIFAHADRGGISGIAVPTEENKAPATEFHGTKLELLGRLAGGVAHDFNNILTAIGGYVDIMLSRFPEGDPTRDSLREIRRQADRAARLTRQLLAFGRRQVFQTKVYRLNTILNDMFRMLERVMGDRMTLELDLETTLGNVRIDRGQFEQVVMNLVLNARDALQGNGGRVTLKTQNAEIRERVSRSGQVLEPGPYIRFAVSDTGDGMDEETLARLFEPFFTNKKGKGTGLGLSTVYGIVKQSGGSIFVESVRGHGATFDIWLPRVSEAVDESSATASASRGPASGGAETILVAEDEPGVRAVTVTQLKHKGYTVLEAGNGEEALRIASEHRGIIQLLLTDVVMPGMTGPQLAAEIVKVRPRIRILFMTGYADQDIDKLAGSAVLHKPFRLETLAQKVREALDVAR